MRRVLLSLPPGMPFSDPVPEETAKREVELATDWDGTAAGVVGWAEGGRAALELAATHAEAVERLVLVSVPPAEDADLDAIQAKTLLVYGAKDPDGGYAHGKWWRDRLNARLEMVPDGGRDILERMWPRILSHAAPRTLRRT